MVVTVFEMFFSKYFQRVPVVNNHKTHHLLTMVKLIVLAFAFTTTVAAPKRYTMSISSADMHPCSRRTKNPNRRRENKADCLVGR